MQIIVKMDMNMNRIWKNSQDKLYLKVITFFYRDDVQGNLVLRAMLWNKWIFVSVS